MEKKPLLKRVALMGRHHPERIEATLYTLHQFLTTHHYGVVCDEETANCLSFPIQTVPIEQLYAYCDVLIVVGGDGSLLHAAKIAVAQSLPVLGINRGRLGFLTDIYPQDLASIEQVLTGNYYEENRFLLECEMWHSNAVIATIDALNEIVLSPGNIAHMIEFAVSINQELVCDLRADGLIVATPTGSTAYALSGGGPILDPAINALVLVPMFPHTLSNRPLVVGADSQLIIEITANNDATAFVSGDGQKCIPIALGDLLYIRKKKNCLRLIHPCSYSYFQTLRSKLGWQSKHGF